MATIVNTQPGTESSGSGMGMLLGAAIFLVVAILAVFVLLPALTRGVMNGGAAPQGGVNVPEQVDVNVNGGGQ